MLFWYNNNNSMKTLSEIEATNINSILYFDWKKNDKLKQIIKRTIW